MSRAEFEEISEGLITAYANKFSVSDSMSCHQIAHIS